MLLRASARLASRRETHAHRRRADLRLALRFRPLFLSQRARADRQAAAGPTSICPRWRATSRRASGTMFSVRAGQLGIPRGTIRATVLIETILAAFEMDEILYELREHSAGPELRPLGLHLQLHQEIPQSRPEFVLPDRSLVTMERHFLSAYVELLIQICHRRGIHAMGGMAAQIPIRNDAAANELALEKVRQDKVREVKAGHDGTWVAHPGLVGLAKDIFDQYMPEPNQIQSRAPIVPSAHAIFLKFRAARSPKKACAGISTWASNTYGHGCARRAACPSIT